MDKRIFNPLKWRKSFLGLLLGGFVLIWFLFLDTYSLYTRINLNNRKEELKSETQKLKQENEKLKEQIHQIKTDTNLVEEIAREKYGMRKPGEKIYKIREDKE
mgnify:FL=1|jgi:cell division protein FtsB